MDIFSKIAAGEIPSYKCAENEADLRAGKISIKTPIAQGLLGKKVGDEVEITIPRGTIKLRIENISIA